VSWLAPDYGVILDGDGQTVSAQYNWGTQTLSFWANEIPSIGYRVFWYVPTALPTPTPAPQEWVLDNGYLRVEICEQTGNIASIWDYAAQCHVLSEPGNVLQFFQDQGQYWDAWNIDPNYAQHLLEPATLVSIAMTDMIYGEVEQGIEVVRQWRNSTFTQTYRLPRNASVLNIETQVDWQETHVLVKTAFPLSVTSPSATYESPCAAIARPTLPNPQPLTDHEKAKWEVPALHWADLTEADGSYGVSLLNDCKYGYDAQPSCLRLTLLRSPRWPDPECDRGMHQFTYALYPHRGDWQTAQTVRRGYELNRPLLCLELSNPCAMAGQLDLAHSFLSDFPDHAVLMAMKQSESSPQEWIVRLHEAHGQAGTLSLHTTLPLTPQSETDGLEQPTGPIDSALGPWQVRSQAWSRQSPRA
ncbi:MAG TPA: glycoside hydrolase family 38 C-terminal domain-containing protein, partial [Stenomitos sp.]